MQASPILIVGAGPAGSCLGALLADQGWPVTLLEAGRLDGPQPPSAALSQRTLALAAPAWQVLGQLGLTPASLQAQPIRSIHVSYRGQPGRVCLEAAESGQDSFGHTVNYDTLLAALRAALMARPGVRLLGECHVQQVTAAAAAARVRWQDAQGAPHAALTPLAVLAEGGRLAVGRDSVQWRYRQQALACVVRTSVTGKGCAYERFTPEGPIALLPVPEGYGLIWTGSAARIESLLAADDQAFLRALQDWFGDRVGAFVAVGPRQHYPLQARFSLRTAQSRVLRVANAAQTLHPVAGQGFNLGLRDITALLDLLAPLAPGTGVAGDPGRSALLLAHARQRRRDRWVTGGVTHLLAEGFALPGSGWMAGKALTWFDLHQPLRQRFARLMAAGAGA